MTRVWIVAAAFVALAGQAQAGGRCSQPYAPVVKVGPSTTAQEMKSLRDDVQAFIAASDLFQACLNSQGAASDMRIDLNETQKERVGREFNQALSTFKRTHPG